MGEDKALVQTRTPYGMRDENGFQLYQIDLKEGTEIRRYQDDVKLIEYNPDGYAYAEKIERYIR